MVLDLWDELHDIERRFDYAFRALPVRRIHMFPMLPVAWHQPFNPAAEVFTRNEDLVIRLELPAVDVQKDVTITVDDGELVVRGERMRKEDVKEEGYHLVETAYGRFVRRFPVPAATDEKKVKAEYRDGILEIVLPAVAKALEPAKAKAIPIKTVSKSAA
jgi:HSP20 family protein